MPGTVRKSATVAPSMPLRPPKCRSTACIFLAPRPSTPSSGSSNVERSLSAFGERCLRSGALRRVRARARVLGGQAPRARDRCGGRSPPAWPTRRRGSVPRPVLTKGASDGVEVRLPHRGAEGPAHSSWRFNQRPTTSASCEGHPSHPPSPCRFGIPFGRTTVAHHHACTNAFRPLQLGHVEADHVVQGVEAEQQRPSSAACCSRLPGATRRRRTCTSAFWSQAAQGGKVATRRDAAFHPPFSPLLQPLSTLSSNGVGAREGGAVFVIRSVQRRTRTRSHRGRHGGPSARPPDSARPPSACSTTTAARSSCTATADGVAVAVHPARDDVLGDHFAHRADPVPNERGLLEGHRGRGFVHLCTQSSSRSDASPLRMRRAPPQRVPCSLRLDARACTQPDVHRKAALREQFLAVPQAEVPPKQLHDLLCGPGVWERAPL